MATSLVSQGIASSSSCGSLCAVAAGASVLALLQKNRKLAHARGRSDKAVAGRALKKELSGQAPAARLCGATQPTVQPSGSLAKTAARYTTEKILPSFQWLKTGLKTGDLAPTELRALNMAGVDVLIGKNQSGGLFCVGNLCPHLGTPMSEGADIIGDVIVCPLHGSSFKTTNGELIDWCPSPPIIGPLTGLVIEKKALAVFEIKTSFLGDDIEVKIDTNAKKAYEADYWKGLLDAQGKVDGTYY